VSGVICKKVEKVSMVWRDLYGKDACREARSRQDFAVEQGPSFWQELVTELCRDVAAK
jgi:hypothetical protein